MIEVFLDYPVIDHLWRMDNGKYVGRYGAALAMLRQNAIDGEVRLWMSEITKVEMVQGQQNPRLTKEKHSRACENDRGKLLIATTMRVRWLTYPCSKTDDEYSLLDLSFRCAGPEWSDANALERRLEAVPGVSKGDARHLVSWLFGSHTDDLDLQPTIPYFVSEDEALRDALVRVQPTAANAILKSARIRSVDSLLKDVVAT